MIATNSLIIIIIVILVVAFLIYSQSKPSECPSCPSIIQPFRQMGNRQMGNHQMGNHQMGNHQIGERQFNHHGDQHPYVQNDPRRYNEQNLIVERSVQPTAINVNVNNDDIDPYADQIKKQDLYSMYDPLTYPQARLPRDVLMKYNDYFAAKGVYPPFNESTQPNLFESPVLAGMLIKTVNDHEPFDDNVPSAVPLIKVKSTKNSNRYFYYIIDQRYLSKLELKIPLDNVKVNGKCYTDAKMYGLPELFDGDTICDISIFPYASFRVNLYETYYFP